VARPGSSVRRRLDCIDAFRNRPKEYASRALARSERASTMVDGGALFRLAYEAFAHPPRYLALRSLGANVPKTPRVIRGAVQYLV